MKKFRVWFAEGGSRQGVTVQDHFEDWDNVAFLEGVLSVSNNATYETPTYYPLHRIQKVESVMIEEVPQYRQPGISLDERRMA